MKILELDLYTPDLEATRLFYVQRLGLSVLARSADSLTVRIGWTQLTFRSVCQPVNPYHIAINVPRGSLEVIMHYFDLDYLDTQQPGKTIADFPDWRARACYFYDGTGNLLEFIARTDLPLDNPNLTINDLFQGVSEIGLATEDVACTSEQIQERFAVPQYDKSTPMPDFNALGDDNGLFILSRVGRKWLFSATPAGLNYCRVRFLNGPDRSSQELYFYEVNRLPIGWSVRSVSASESRSSLAV
ncbi:VOC family protein [Spirosoma spitsbergense]|jgi:catechol 2,3-dioxygenase-like lactoylglutathione lyase family enzyme|uniref:VOC family protein n=1 Tax=Spirosoma spitsbergense TaxID=431554 RepID=UPI00036E70B3|nr:glyoxalase/bleomycin resistance/dioxygenase family protein [Spirosoma spitsbergense]